METDQSSAPLSKKIFILGSTGRTGKEVIDIALARGHEVTAFGRSPAKITRRHQRLTVVKGDPRSAKELSTALLGPRSGGDRLRLLVPRRRAPLQAHRGGALRIGARLDQKPELFFTLRRMALDRFRDQDGTPSRITAEGGSRRGLAGGDLRNRAGSRPAPPRPVRTLPRGVRQCREPGAPSM